MTLRGPLQRKCPVFFWGGSPQNPENPQNSAPSSTKKIQIRHPQKHTKFSLRFTEAPHLWCEDGVEPRGGCVFFSKTPIFVTVTTRRYGIVRKNTFKHEVYHLVFSHIKKYINAIMLDEG